MVLVNERLLFKVQCESEVEIVRHVGDRKNVPSDQTPPKHQDK